MNASKQIYRVVVITCFFLPYTMRAEAVINFDEASLGASSSVTSFYDGVTLNGITNTISKSGGAYPVPDKVPSPLGDTVIWSHKNSGQFGGSGANLAVGLVNGLPGQAGILLTFKDPISSLTVTGLDYGSSEEDSSDIEEMTLAAYDAQGHIIGRKHFTERLPGTNAIIGTLDFAGTKYVTFNYTSTNGFFGIDDLSFRVFDEEGSTRFDDYSARAKESEPEPCPPLERNIRLGEGASAIEVRLGRTLDPVKDTNTSRDSYCFYTGQQVANTVLKAASLGGPDTSSSYEIPLSGLDISLYRARDTSPVSGRYKDISLVWSGINAHSVIERWGLSFSPSELLLNLDTKDSGELYIKDGSAQFNVRGSQGVDLGGGVYLHAHSSTAIRYLWQSDSSHLADGKWMISGLAGLSLQVRHNRSSAVATMNMRFNDSGKARGTMRLLDSPSWNACGLEFTLLRSTLTAEADFYSGTVDIVGGALSGRFVTTGPIESDHYFSLVWRDGKLHFKAKDRAETLVTGQTCPDSEIIKGF